MDNSTKQGQESESNMTKKITRRIVVPYLNMLPKKEIESEIVDTTKTFIESYKEKPETFLPEILNFIHDGLNEGKVLKYSAEILQEVTNSTGHYIYLVHETKNELKELSENERPIRYKKIKIGTTISAYVCYKKEYLVTNNIERDTRYPQGLGYEVDNVKGVLCVPILSPHGDCLAAVELYKDWHQRLYTQEEVEYVILTCGWIGAAMHQSRERLALQKIQELNECLLDFNHAFFSKDIELEKMITEIMKLIKASTKAEKGTFFIIDSTGNDFTADVYEESIKGKFAMIKKNMKLNLSTAKGVVGIVARQGITVKMNNLQKEIRYAEANRNEIIPKCIISTPIYCGANIIAVVQLVNKSEGVLNYYSKEDESLCKIFSVYCSLALYYEQKREYIKRVSSVNDCYLNLLRKHMSPCIHDQNLVKEHSEDEYPTGFLQFNWYIPMVLYDHMAQYTIMMIRDLVGAENVNFDILKLFVLTVKNAYRPVPYHNYEHAFTFTHCAFNILRRNSTVFSALEIQAFMVAAICHDVDHRGVTNSFLELTKHNLSTLYEESIWENHHSHVASIIINRCWFFKDMSEEMYKSFLKEIKDLILATDLAVYFKHRSKILHALASNTFEWDAPYHRYLFKCIIMNACDLSSNCKPYDIAKTTAENLYKEFYAQGDIEKTFGLVPLSLMDREKEAMIPDDQIHFLTILVLPCMDILRMILPNTVALYDGASRLRKAWALNREV